MISTRPIISIRVDEKLKADIEKLAELDERSVSQYVERLLKAHVEEKLQKSGKKRAP